MTPLICIKSLAPRRAGPLLRASAPATPEIGSGPASLFVINDNGGRRFSFSRSAPGVVRGADRVDARALVPHRSERGARIERLCRCELSSKGTLVQCPSRGARLTRREHLFGIDKYQ